MNIEHYHKYLSFEKQGLKKLASESIREFIASFRSNEAISLWVWKYLPNLKANKQSRIRHEIFVELVYPVLKKGYFNNDFNSTLWLSKLAQNIYQNPKIHEALGWVSEMELLRKCHVINPGNDEARLLLVNAIVSWLRYSEHEWPSGILYSNDGATLEQCEDICLEVDTVLKLDKEQHHSDFIKEYKQKLNQYQARLKKSL